MTTISFRESPHLRGSDRALASPYWIILASYSGTPGSIFTWDGSGWTTALSDALLHDNPGDALAEEHRLSDLPEQRSAVVRAVNLADYLARPGDELRDLASAEALRSLYRQAGIGAGL